MKNLVKFTLGTEFRNPSQSMAGYVVRKPSGLLILHPAPADNLNLISWVPGARDAILPVAFRGFPHAVVHSSIPWERSRPRIDLSPLMRKKYPSTAALCLLYLVLPASLTTRYLSGQVLFFFMYIYFPYASHKWLSPASGPLHLAPTTLAQKSNFVHVNIYDNLLPR